jgi:hypothetical protein
VDAVAAQPELHLAHEDGEEPARLRRVWLDPLQGRGRPCLVADILHENGVFGLGDRPGDGGEPP